MPRLDRLPGVCEVPLTRNSDSLTSAILTPQRRYGYTDECTPSHRTERQTMPSIQLSAVSIVILAALPLAGCGDSRNASWPGGTEAVVSAPEPRDVIAHVPKDQQDKIPRNALVIASQTPVVIVDDSLSRAVKDAGGGVRRRPIPSGSGSRRVTRGSRCSCAAGSLLPGQMRTHGRSPSCQPPCCSYSPRLGFCGRSRHSCCSS